MLKPINSNVQLDNDSSFICVNEFIEWLCDCGSNDYCTQTCDGICKPWVR